MSKSERTKRFILEQSSVIFNKKGYSGTSLNDVCEQTGLTKGAIYAYYKDKEDLALSALMHNTSRIIEGFQEHIARATTTVDRIMALGAYYGSHAMELFENGGCPFLNAAVEFDDQSGAIADSVKANFGLWRDALTGIIQQGIDKGEVKHEVDKEKYADLFIAMIEGGIMMSHLYKSPARLIDIFEQIRKITLNEILITETHTLN